MNTIFHRWFFGTTSRKECEKLLTQQGGREGLFLIRKSETASKDASLNCGLV